MRERNKSFSLFLRNSLEDFSMKRDRRLRVIIAMLGMFSCLLAAVPPTPAQTPAQKEAARVETREKLRALLAASGPKRGIETAFRQSEKQPFNFVGVKRDKFTN